MKDTPLITPCLKLSRVGEADEVSSFNAVYCPGLTFHVKYLVVISFVRVDAFRRRRIHPRADEFRVAVFDPMGSVVNILIVKFPNDNYISAP